METVFQVSLLAVSVCVGAAALVLRSAGGRSSSSSSSSTSIDVSPVSTTWLAEHRVRSHHD